MKTLYPALFLSYLFFSVSIGLSQPVNSINGLTNSSQSLVTGLSGADFNITDDAISGSHTFNIPSASTSARGLVTYTGGLQTFGGDKAFNNKLFLSSGTVSAPSLAFSAATTSGFSYGSGGGIEAISGSFTGIQYFRLTNEGKLALSNNEEFLDQLDINISHDADIEEQDGGVNVTVYGGEELHTCTFGGRTSSGNSETPAATQQYQAMAEFIGKGWNSTDGWEHTNKGVFGIYAAANHSGSSQPAYCNIKTTRVNETLNHGSMVIDPAGNAGLTYLETGLFNTTLPAGWTTSADSRFFSIESRTTTEDAGLLIQNGTTTTGGGVEGLNIWMDNSANITYLDNLQNTDGAYSLFRLKTVGTPLNALSIAFSASIGTCLGTGGNITASPASKIHIDAGNATASDVRWTAGSTTGQSAADGFQIGITVGAVAEIRQRENEDMWLYTNNAVRFSLLSGGYIVTGNTKENRYRTTDGGSNINSHLYIDPTSSSGTGSIAWGFDDNNYFFCTQMNNAGTPKRILGMAIKPVSVSTTEDHEAMDMAFYTQLDGSAATEKMRITDEGNVGIGITSPGAVLQIKAGTATASTAPIKLTSGTNLTTAEAGAVEYNNSFYQTKNSGLRYGVGGTIFDNYTDISNSGTTETDLYTYTTPSGTLAADGEKIIAHYTGMFNTPSEEGIIKLYFAGTEIFSSGTLTGSGGSASTFDINIIIIRTGSETARASVTMISPFRGIGMFTKETDLSSITFTSTNILKITGQSPTGAGGDITAKLASGFWHPAANN